MPFANYKELIADEMDLASVTNGSDILDMQWDRFASESPVELQYLLTKRGVARSLVSKLRKRVDTQIGFDQIKGSQMVKNLLSLIDDITSEIEEQFPEFSSSNNLKAHSPSASAYLDEDI